VTFTVNTAADTAVAVLGAGTALDAYGNVSLRSAVQESRVTGDSVVIQFTGLTGTIALTTPLPALDNAFGITINNASGSSNLTVKRDSSAGSFDIFQVASNTSATIGGLTIRNGLVPTSRGGAILNYGNLTLSAVNITANAADSGGAIANLADSSTDQGPSLTLINTTITNNQALYGDGGAIYNEGNVTIGYNSVLNGNVAQDSGGAIFNTAGLTINNSTLSNNTAMRGNGGGIYTPGSLTMQDATVLANNCAAKISYGGGIYVSGSATINGGLVKNNVATTGSGIYVVAGAPFEFSGQLINNNIVTGPPPNMPGAPPNNAPPPANNGPGQNPPGGALPPAGDTTGLTTGGTTGLTPVPTNPSASNPPLGDPVIATTLTPLTPLT
jgi:predicted outer membrane repeat protein